MTTMMPTTYLNSSEVNDNVTQLNTDEESNDNTDVVRVIHVVCRPILIVFGTIGNCLTFYIMRRGSMKHVSTCFYMSVLALADSGVLWSGGFVAWMGHLTRGEINPRLWTDCKFYYFFFYFCTHYSSALLVIMCIEKCFALYFPLRTKSICTVHTAKRVTFGATLILLAYNTQLLFIYDAVTKADGSKTCNFEASESYESIFNRVDSILYSFGPFALMILANCAIIYKFMMAKWQNRHGGTESLNQALSKSATKGTVMLVTVSMTFVILTGPLSVFYVITNDPPPLVYAITIIMTYANHSINAVLYCISGSRFRDELIDTLCYRSKKNMKRSLTQSNSMSVMGSSHINNTSSPLPPPTMTNIAETASPM